MGHLGFPMSPWLGDFVVPRCRATPLGPMAIGALPTEGSVVGAPVTTLVVVCTGRWLTSSRPMFELSERDRGRPRRSFPPPGVRSSDLQFVGWVGECVSICQDDLGSRYSTDALATSSPPSSAKNVVGFGVVAEESIRLGSAHVRKFIHAGREVARKLVTSTRLHILISSATSRGACACSTSRDAFLEPAVDKRSYTKPMLGYAWLIHSHRFCLKEDDRELDGPDQYQSYSQCEATPRPDFLGFLSLSVTRREEASAFDHEEKWTTRKKEGGKEMEGGFVVVFLKRKRSDEPFLSLLYFVFFFLVEHKREQRRRGELKASLSLSLSLSLARKGIRGVAAPHPSLVLLGRTESKPLAIPLSLSGGEGHTGSCCSSSFSGFAWDQKALESLEDLPRGRRLVGNREEGEDKKDERTCGLLSMKAANGGSRFFEASR
ncbi:hypothetical protein B296_00025855 [Ensete ventricosum]|uniref:Uncharacterized protein n=1 Tax=Ensete ventricosum TaxID=4639 RepID=A0A426Y826_ENSVE|nr:hypothetical protein B296_00025855 [Ensete ventricosum]